MEQEWEDRENRGKETLSKDPVKSATLMAFFLSRKKP